VDHLFPEGIDEVADADDVIVAVFGHRQIFNIEKMMENAASVTITKKIDSTTD
jgi:ribosomal silencing factor RsfS